MYNLKDTPACGAFNAGAEDKNFPMKSNAYCCSPLGEFGIILSRRIGVKATIFPPMLEINLHK
jgi:hypothetical protein